MKDKEQERCGLPNGNNPWFPLPGAILYMNIYTTQ